MEPRRPPDVAAERGAAHRPGAERVDRSEHQADVAGDDLDRGGTQRAQDQRQHLGVAGGGVLPVEDLDPGLQVFARLRRAASCRRQTGPQ